MAIGNEQITIGTTATAIITDDYDGQRVVIRNMSSSRSVFIGDSDVTINDGHELIKDSNIELFLGPGEEIYGVVAEGTETVCYLATMNE
ncbi:hypothetical protein LCGC14_2893380 [marine sediment metagenome]|uniref:Uncharacterized protein n=1 Tax=marine sediment metagenome TaxID=412755 RepID=A0A0F8XWY3_9ZZZZ